MLNLLKTNMDTREVIRAIYIVDFKFNNSLGKKWNSLQQKLFIKEIENIYLNFMGRIIWSIVILKEAYEIGEWLNNKGYSSYERYKWTGYTDIPYDCNMWQEWIDTTLFKYNGDTIITNDDIKNVSIEMVKRRFIKIPINSRNPLYFWIMEGYKDSDFCNIYRAIEFCKYIKVDLNDLQICLNKYSSKVLKAKTGFRMISLLKSRDIIGYDMYEFNYTMKVLKNIYVKYKNRKIYNNAIIIQNSFRSYMSIKIANILRSNPDNLFDSNFSNIRKRKLNIDDSFFN